MDVRRCWFDGCTTKNKKIFPCVFHIVFRYASVYDGGGGEVMEVVARLLACLS